VPVLTAHLFALVYRHFMTFSFFSAGHIVSVFPLVLKADNIESFFRTANNYSHSFQETIVYGVKKFTMNYSLSTP
jgi:hypothetical protein